MAIALTPIEQRVRDYLIARARQADPSKISTAKIEYNQLGRALDPDEDYWSYPRFRGLGTVLGNVSQYEHEHGRPLLSALVVQAGTGQAGDGFFKGLLVDRLGIDLPVADARAYWRDEIRKAITYWQAAPGEPDRQAQILALLTSADQAIRQAQALIAAG